MEKEHRTEILLVFNLKFLTVLLRYLTFGSNSFSTYLNYIALWLSI